MHGRIRRLTQLVAVAAVAVGATLSLSNQPADAVDRPQHIAAVGDSYASGHVVIGAGSEHGASTLVPSGSSGSPASSAAEAAPVTDRGIHPVAPVRVLDTTTGLGLATPGRLPGRTAVSFAVGGVGGLPTTGVGTFVLSVTAWNAATSSATTFYPTGQSRPNMAQLQASSRASGTVLVTPGTDGAVTVYVSSTVDVRAFVVGWMPPDASFRATTPMTVINRQAGASQTVRASVLGVGGVPATEVAAVALMVSALQPTTAGELVAYTAGSAAPSMANVRFAAQRNTAGLALVVPSRSGVVAVTNRSAGTARVRVDVVGWFGTNGFYTPVTPALLVDSRTGVGVAKGRIASHQTVTVDVTSAGGIPQVDVGAVAISVEVIRPAQPGSVSVRQSGTKLLPAFGSVTFDARRDAVSTVIVRPGSGGIVALYNSSAGPIDVRVDAVGWMQPGKNEADVANVVPLSTTQVTLDEYDPAGTTVLTVPDSTPVEPGNVIVLAPTAALPKGLIGIVETIEPSRGDMVVTTTPGTIANVIPTFDIGVSPDWPGNVTPDPEAPHRSAPTTASDRLLAEAVAGQAPQTTAPDATNDWDCGSDFDVHTSYQAILGNLRITGGVRLPLSQSSFSMTVSPTIIAHIDLTARSLTCTFDVSGLIAPLPKLYFAIPTPIGYIPFWIDQYVDLGATATLTAEAPTSATFDVSGTGTFGVAFSPGGATPFANASVTPSFSVDPPTWARFQGSIWLRGQYHAFAYGLIGVTVGIGPELTLAGPGADPEANRSYWMRLSGALKGTIAGDCNIAVPNPFGGKPIRLCPDLPGTVIQVPNPGLPIWTWWNSPPPMPPGAPRNVRAIPRDGSAIVSWDPPNDLGTSPQITDYKVRSSRDGGVTWNPAPGGGTDTSRTVALPNDGYQFEVAAVTTHGTGPWSDPSPRVILEPNLWTQISIGVTHACGIRPSGAALCWGDNSYGQLGNGSTRASYVPTSVTGLDSGVTQIVAGQNTTCAIKRGDAYCWGLNDHGQLGAAPKTDPPDPSEPTPIATLVKEAPDSPVTSLTLGTAHACATKRDGITLPRPGGGERRVFFDAVYCWGLNNHGQLGNGTTTDTWVPQRVIDDRATAVAAGFWHTCAVVAGAVKCWGDNANGQLGNGTTAASLAPTPTNTLTHDVAAVSASMWETCALQSHAVYCWGKGALGGSGTPVSANPALVWLTRSSTPIAVGLPGATATTDVAVGGGHVCALLNWGPVYCWGDNTYGQLGTGVTGVEPNRTVTLPFSATPVESRLPAASTVSAGDKSSCAVLTDRTGWCWGENFFGQLGTGTTTGGLPNRPTRVDDAGEPPPTIVSLGDSFISGEGGRWAGNTNHIEDTWMIDALGPTAYNDNDGNTAEQIAHCHRSKSAEIFIGADVSSINLACSGAKTSSAFPDPDTGWDKPGIDDADDGNGNIGQALALQRLAPERNVKLIVLSIGGNNFHFGDLVAKCVTAYLAMPKPGECRNDPAITGPGGYLSPGALSTGTAAIVGAIAKIRIAMGIAGYAPGDYGIVVQNYPSVIPKASGFRYAESFWRRQNIGGCGFRDADADFANDTVIPQINIAVNDAITVVNQDRGYNPVRLLDISNAFDGHRLCENSVNVIEQTKHASWTSPGAVDATEWVNQIRLATKAAQPPYQFEESFHPNYWGQLALRNCVRLIWNGGNVGGGKCTSTGGLNSFGEPNMSLQPI